MRPEGDVDFGYRSCGTVGQKIRDLIATDYGVFAGYERVERCNPFSH
jgi:hypothetical protein